jgi:hypothetical protein
LDSWSGGRTPQPNISVVARSKPLKLIEFVQRYERFFSGGIAAHLRPADSLDALTRDDGMAYRDRAY